MNQKIQNYQKHDFRILIVGAGIAGLTLAGLLKKDGFKPVVIERDTKETFNTSGYMIGLMPLGAQVLNKLNLYSDYTKHSLAISDYGLYSLKGKLLNHFGMDAIISNLGSYQSISRPQLIKLLQSTCDEPRFGVTVKSFSNTADGKQITFSDGSVETFDLVVIADGIHSTTRQLAFGKDDYAYRQTGWGGWAWFVDNPPQLAHTYREYWGADRFLGLYPVENNKLGIFLGGNMKDIKKKGHAAIAAATAKKIKHADLDFANLLKPLQESDDLFFWDFHDCRTEKWVNGNVVLVGDAADGFLPTAGVGASMAMDSAARLADELSRMSPQYLPYALKLYEDHQKQRVVTAQSTSRTLGNLMFIKNPVLAGLRNATLRFMTVNSFLKSIRKLIENR
ncbi:MAG TPA: NAD(P)/FAD-dependent oxidoreductase [Candidatus Saccharimonadales bacterium]|nr:NAD(P)/FAD-dependent oxidoreductase [Candidatus Saccharimonadales bacterium]